MKKIDFQYESLVQYTKLSKKQQKKLINWFSNQNTVIQIDVFTEQKNQFFKLKSEYQEVNILPLAAFLLAISNFYLLESSNKTKNKQNDLSGCNKVSRFLVKKAKKERYKIKREKLLNIWSVVKNLKLENYSFREISNYIKSRHRFSVSHTYINQIWKELENES